MSNNQINNRSETRLMIDDENIPIFKSLIKDNYLNYYLKINTLLAQCSLILFGKTLHLELSKCESRKKNKIKISYIYSLR